MDRVKVASSNVAEVGWEGGTLEVLYRNGGLYRYSHVPTEVYAELLTAPSIGAFLHHSIKPLYPCSKVEEKQMPESDAVSIPADPSGLNELEQQVLAARPVQQPSVRRAVSYWAFGTPGGEHPALADRAAVITEVDEPGNPESAVGLAVLNPTGLFFNRHVPFSPVPKGGCWSWPEYVPAK